MTHPDVLSWLLKSKIPSIRYFTLKRLLQSPMDDPRLLAARQAMQAEGPIPAILSRQSELGSWTGERVSPARQGWPLPRHEPLPPADLPRGRRCRGDPPLGHLAG